MAPRRWKIGSFRSSQEPVAHSLHAPLPAVTGGAGRCAFFSGHRDLGCSNQTVDRLLKDLLPTLIERGYTDFCCGGAMGFDTRAALAVLAARQQDPRIRLVLELPCKEQDKTFPQYDRLMYQKILNLADEVHYAYESYVRGCMFARNRRMVDRSTLGVFWLDTTLEKGGTLYTYRYAQKKDCVCINLRP